MLSENKLKKNILVLLIIFEIISFFVIFLPALKLIYDTKNLTILQDKNLYQVINKSDPNKVLSEFDIEQTKNYFLNKFYNEEICITSYKYLADIDQYGNKFQRRVANYNFFQYFSFNLYSGRMFTSEDFILNDSTSVIPIIVGYNLKDLFPLNSVHTFYSGENDQSFKANVIGILETDSSYPRVYTISESLDDSYIIPMSIGFVERYFGLSDFDMAVSNTIFCTDDESKLSNILQDSDIFSFEIQSLNKIINVQKENILITIKFRLKYWIILSIIISLITVILIKLQKLIRRFYMRGKIK